MAVRLLHSGQQFVDVSIAILDPDLRSSKGSYESCSDTSELVEADFNETSLQNSVLFTCDALPINLFRM